MNQDEAKKLIDRREFIRRMGLTSGAFLLSPILYKLIGEAWGATYSQKRFIIYMNGTSMWPQFTQTQGSGANFVLPYALKPLEPYQKDLNVLRNLYCNVYPNLHGNMYGVLSGVPCIGISAGDNEAYLKARPGAATIDTILSQELGGGTRHQEMVLGYVRPGQTCLANGRDNVKTPVMNVSEAFQKFITGNTGAPTVDRNGQIKKSVLDFTKGDIARAQRGLAGSEKGKFEEFLSSVEDLEKRVNLTIPPVAGCGTQSLPTKGTGLNGTNYPINFNYSNLGGMEWLAAPGFIGNSFVQAEMIAMAMGCGVTRHATFVSQLGEIHQYYGDLGMQNVDVHEHINHGILNGKAEWNRPAEDVMRFHASVVARMYERLKATPEGSGTAADNTVILWLSDCGGSHHYGHFDGTAFLLGNAGGALQTGQSLTFGNRQWSISQLLYTIAKAIGSNITQVGDGSNPGSTAIDGLLTSPPV